MLIDNLDCLIGCLAVLCLTPSAFLTTVVMASLKFCQSLAFYSIIVFNLFAVLQLYVTQIWECCK